VPVRGKFDAPLLTTCGNVYVHMDGKFDAPLLVVSGAKPETS